MGRQLRKVAANWEHPKNKEGNYIPLFDGKDFQRLLDNWIEGKKQWDKGFRSDWNGGWIKKEENELDLTYRDWNGSKPKKKDYMPEWNENELTHIQLYENTSEGTPQTIPFKIDELEKLCEYASEHATIWGHSKMTKEEWHEFLKDSSVLKS